MGLGGTAIINFQASELAHERSHVACVTPQESGVVIARVLLLQWSMRSSQIKRYIFLLVQILNRIKKVSQNEKIYIIRLLYSSENNN
jgi:hypothetical protein